MLRRVTYLMAAVTLLAAQGAHAAYFELLPTYDTYVSNDGTEGPDTNHETGSGMHVRRICAQALCGVMLLRSSRLKKSKRSAIKAHISRQMIASGTITTPPVARWFSRRRMPA